MDNTLLINQKVEIIAVFNNGVDASSLCFPAKMKYKNQLIEFSELGFKHPTFRGKKMIHIFEMSDGINDYRLEFDAESLIWTLIAITEG
ncbi:MAG TPA: hypothetical protein VII94_01635 [Candidatus Saccharimonadales bacterium]